MYPNSWNRVNPADTGSLRGFGALSTVRALSSREKSQPMCRHLVHLLARIRQREVLFLRPERQQIAVVRAPQLPGLPRRARRPAQIPVGEVEHLAIGSPVNLVELLVVPRVVWRVHVAGT